jgi:hypothetical protein
MTVTAAVMDYTSGQYVSGTNQSFEIAVTCAANPSYSGQSPWTSATLTSMTLTIGGQSVTLPAVTGQWMEVQWDTTHFSSGGTGIGTVIELTGNYTLSNASGSASLSATVDAPVTIYNVGFSGEIADYTKNYPAAATIGGDITSVMYCDVATSATRAQCYDPIPVSTVYYVNANGWANPSSFSDPSVWMIYATDVLAQREASTFPPVSFAFVDVCFTGSNTAMGSAFLYPTTSLVDRAEMGWIVEAGEGWAPILSIPLFQYLMAACPVATAEYYAYESFLTTPDPDPDDAEVKPSTAAAALAIYGDESTTVTGLYCLGGGLGAWHNVLVLTAVFNGG